MQRNEYLERLMIDRALGDLPQETEWLLEEYLANHPEKRTELDLMRKTVGSIKQAVKAMPRVEQPLPPMPDLQPPKPFGWLQLALWPAVCLLCLVLGWQLAQRNEPVQPAPVIIVEQPVKAAPTTVTAEKQEPRTAGIWSMQRWKTKIVSAELQTGGSNALRWDAPFKINLKGGAEG